jgi:NAD-dependent dihydropyrimidine dehydrogenase PreA subunit
MGPLDLDQIELAGIDPLELPIPDFKLPLTVSKRGDRVFKLLYPFFKNGFSVKPRIIEDTCVSCGACRDACPVQVITIAEKGSPAHIEDKGCIRCYCCHEMCPHDSIELRSGLLYRLFNRK